MVRTGMTASVYADERIAAAREALLQTIEAAASAPVTPEEVERVTGVPGEQMRRVAEKFAKEKPATIIWCMGATQHTVGTANVRAFCTVCLATGNVGSPGTGANIFRGHTNVQGATDLGLDITSLPLYYGLTEAAWKH